MAARARGPWLTAAAVLFGILAITDLVKPLASDAQTGFVFLGQRLTGTQNAILGPFFGLVLGMYAFGIWRMRRFALTIGRAYAAYVIANVTLFPFRTPPPPDAGLGYKIFGVVYAVLAIGTSFATYWALARRREELT